MSRKLTATVLCLCLVLLNDLAYARGGRGGGGGGGRGGGGGSARMSGGGGGMSRAPSMSRAAPAARPAPRPSAPRPNTSRPTGGMQRPSTPNRSAGNVANRASGIQSRPGGAGSSNLARPGGAGAGAARSNFGQAASGRSAFENRGNFDRPSANQLDDFLGMPRQSGAASRNTGGSNLGDTNAKTYTTPGGSTITVAGGSGSRQTAGGATVGGAGAAIKVDGANGNSFVKGTGVAGATNGTNSAIAGGSVTAGRGAGGDSFANARGGYADTAGNRAIGGATAVQGRNGYTAANVRGAATSGGVTRVGSATAVRGPAGNTVAAGRGAAFVNGQFVGGRTWGAVNGSFTHWNAFGPGWYNRYPGAWWPGKWALATTAWATATWWVAGGYCGCTGEPVYYDYGNSVYSDGENVYYDDQPVATNQEYYDEASQIAATGAEPTDDSWLPLGVFSVVSDGQDNADKILQLAVNKQGQIRGNYQDLVTNQVTPVTGAVDKDSQRVAIKMEGNDSFLLETGLYNLTNDEAPALLYLGADKPESRTLVRMKQPEDQTAAANAPPTS